MALVPGLDLALFIGLVLFIRPGFVRIIFDFLLHLRIFRELSLFSGPYLFWTFSASLLGSSMHAAPSAQCSSTCSLVARSRCCWLLWWLQWLAWLDRLSNEIWYRTPTSSFLKIRVQMLLETTSTTSNGWRLLVDTVYELQWSGDLLCTISPRSSLLSAAVFKFLMSRLCLRRWSALPLQGAGFALALALPCGGVDYILSRLARSLSTCWTRLACTSCMCSTVMRFHSWISVSFEDKLDSNEYDGYACSGNMFTNITMSSALLPPCPSSISDLLSYVGLRDPLFQCYRLM